MRKWFKGQKSKRPLCDVCGRCHGSIGMLVGEVTPQDNIISGHEYGIVIADGDSRPSMYRLGFLYSETDRDGTRLIFTAAKEWQEDETVTVIIMSRDVRSAREVPVDKSKRYAGRSIVREAE